MALTGHVKKFVFDNEFNTTLIRPYLDSEGIQYHATKPNSNTGNSDVERLNNTITEKIRTFNIEEKLPIITQINKAIMCYNNSFHSSLKCTPFEVQNNKIDHTLYMRNLRKLRRNILLKLMRKENCTKKIEKWDLLKTIKFKA